MTVGLDFSKAMHHKSMTEQNLNAQLQHIQEEAVKSHDELLNLAQSRIQEAGENSDNVIKQWSGAYSQLEAEKRRADTEVLQRTRELEQLSKILEQCQGELRVTHGNLQSITQENVMLKNNPQSTFTLPTAPSYTSHPGPLAMDADNSPLLLSPSATSPDQASSIGRSLSQAASKLQNMPMMVPPFPGALGSGIGGVDLQSDPGPSASNAPSVSAFSHSGVPIPPGLNLATGTRQTTVVLPPGGNQSSSAASGSQRPPHQPNLSTNPGAPGSGGGGGGGDDDPNKDDKDNVSRSSKGKKEKREKEKKEKKRKDKKSKREPSASSGGGGGSSGGGSGSSSSSSASSSSSHKSRRSSRRQPKSKEFSLNALPDIPGFRAWLNTVENKVISSIDLDNTVIYKWIAKACDYTLTDASVRKVPKRFRKADAHLRSALDDILKGQMGRECNLMVEEAKKKEGRILGGFEVLRAIGRYYQTHEDLGVEHTLEDLQAIKFQGDNNLRAMMISWRKVCAAVKASVDEKLLEQMFLRLIQQSTVMANDVAHYHRLPRGHADKNREYLEGLVWTYLDRQLKSKNREVEQNALNNNNPRRTAPTVSAASPLDGALGSVNEVPCEFHFQYNGKRAPCKFGDSCNKSHDRGVYNAYMKKYPNLKPKAKPKPSPKPDRGRPNSRDRGSDRGRSSSAGRGSRDRDGSRGRPRTRSAGAVSNPSQRSTGSIPPSKCCRIHLFHVVNGGPACTRQPCRYPHPTNITKEDNQWAKARKRQGRDHSPACGSVTSESEGERKPGTPGKKKKKKNKKGKKEDK